MSSFLSRAALAASSIAVLILSPMNPVLAAEVVDTHSYANSAEVRTTHLVIDLDVDFAKRRLKGVTELQFEKLKPDADRIVLDTRALDVRSAEASADGKAWAATQFVLGANDAVLGQSLTVSLPAGATRVRIVYSTKPEATGLQWLKPAQTAGKKQPFLFSQSEAIHARSWLPLQDSPAVRATYEASVKTPKGLRAVMSAEMSDQPDAAGRWTFKMPQPIPSYLIALAVGDIAFQSMGPRTGVYAEPATLKAAAYEFAETETTLAVCEKLFGPYRWGRYDLMVLPPSFPFGGMENPRLTFVTPTVITGDRLLVSLIAHELAHSWSGNLVTNATWEDFWLNEGFTEYLTYRLTEAQFGKARGDMERIIGVASLKTDFALAKSDEDRKLVRAFPAKDPDEVFSSIPYERGALFLVWLESKFGRETFDRFLRSWFDDHAFQSATTPQFIAYLNDKLLKAQPGKVSAAQIDAWISQPALPADAVYATSDALTKVDAGRDAWLAGTTTLDAIGAEKWSVQEWEHFFEGFPKTATAAQLKALDTRFKLTGSPNAIIASDWYKLAIDSGQAAALMPQIEAYLGHVGRMKLISPIYRALAATEAGKAQAKAIYKKVGSGYHPIAQQTVERILKGS
ncbi:M1 family metallopeptidase [Nevskia ramosa]|uniref:M1 family metallopeptidase n=1 Tax=Nevskia ramosa TaxID=64002 RepID=UPI0023565160|nr:M1 family metallopeptidase [Nevskia ramosa]